jgi:hypothetical protein
MAVGSSGTSAVVATFAHDAYVNDNRREIYGAGKIHRWAGEEMAGDSVTIDVTEVLGHHGDAIVRGRHNGTYDKSNLPGELILPNYFSVRDGKIVSLIVIRNQPSRY